MLFRKLHQEVHTQEKVKFHMQIKKNLASNMLVCFSMGKKKQMIPASYIFHILL